MGYIYIYIYNKYFFLIYGNDKILIYDIIYDDYFLLLGQNTHKWDTDPLRAMIELIIKFKE